MTDQQLYLARCTELALKGAGHTAPNPLVGAVLVYNNTIIGEGWHQLYGQAHAEVNCINNAIASGHQDKLRESALYVSLEPCSHYGKTPPCADLIARHGIPEVVIGCRDPFAEVNGKGIEKLQQAGVKVELVEWVIANCKFPLSELSILDIGTGSGCIPISLKRRLRKATVSAIDISPGSITVAKKNAELLGTEVNFLELDILDESKWESLPRFDIIISNPPYVPERDKATMHANVLQYEPAAALFVPDEDALLFYRAIARFAKQHLNEGGHLYFEIHENLGQAVMELLAAEGFSATLKKDMQQKDRMVRSGLG